MGVKYICRITANSDTKHWTEHSTERTEIRLYPTASNNPPLGWLQNPARGW